MSKASEILNMIETQLVVVGYSKLLKKPDIQKILDKNKLFGLVGYDVSGDVVISGVSLEVEKIKKLLGKHGLFSFK